jgi:hypothetical protein
MSIAFPFTYQITDLLDVLETIGVSQVMQAIEIIRRRLRV